MPQVFENDVRRIEWRPEDIIVSSNGSGCRLPDASLIPVLDRKTGSFEPTPERASYRGRQDH